MSFSFFAFGASRVSDPEIVPVSQPGLPAAPAAAPMVGLMPGPNWQEQDGVLRDLWLQNKTPQEIADALNRSIAAIMTRAARLGLPRRSAPGRKPGSRRTMDGADGQTRAPRAARHSVRDHDASAPQPSARICLMCLRSFQSMGRHNRICPSCKGSSDYAAAASVADIHLPA